LIFLTNILLTHISFVERLLCLYIQPVDFIAASDNNKIHTHGLELVLLESLMSVIGRFSFGAVKPNTTEAIEPFVCSDSLPIMKNISMIDALQQIDSALSELHVSSTTDLYQLKFLKKIGKLILDLDTPGLAWEPAVVKILILINTQHFKLDLRHLNPLFLKIIIRCVLYSQSRAISSKRKYFFSILNKYKYFKKVSHIDDAFKIAFSNNNALAFEDLLDHKNILPNADLIKYANKFQSGALPNLHCYNLFPLLNPEDYKNKKWRQLTSYEKLYWLAFDQEHMKKLAHRIGLKGNIQCYWQGHSYSTLGIKLLDKSDDIVELEGEEEGRSLLQFKRNLLLFQVSMPQEKIILDEALSHAVELISNVEPMLEHQFKHKLNDKKNHIYIFPFIDEHTATGYHTVDGWYYQINMGFLSGDEPGIHVYRVPNESRVLTHGQLTNLQYKHKTEHLYNIENLCGLKKIAYIKLPGQPCGNCSYESLKGLFCAILFDNLCQTYSLPVAATKTLTLYRMFCEYDINDAIFDYRQHALSINQELIRLAYSKKQSLLESQVFDDTNFSVTVFSSETDDELHFNEYQTTSQSRVSLKCH
tara:strand:- start:220433 stop:222196 length:1764 start_codon:yes stop_codon:yes gene_type:complete